ncbi:uncharacterized protein B0I36DRAFT_387048 [Microdochium trichocladiopsis]|uniref:P-loop containing nucleoside triphosphate hydrolase protein n=1 Tax=Microdochium trichocladiopsis TaxID=1682393 RepID=A0A9P8Y0B5_9PEZI|nr:uncharacterized protein B0I36DRAFT_387048 [Microdochium trichocladiopsis]KAH7024487.1 hypothetical protein B0I36DRAFT_387048 [Microdochium trichocladiopsis]
MAIDQSAINNVLEHVLRRLEHHKQYEGQAMNNGPRPFVLGLSGMQGSGKSTWAASLADALRSRHRLKVVILSIDDLYSTHDRLVQVRHANQDNKLFRNRGQPGTHDESLAQRFFSALLSGQDIAVPAFDKSRYNGEGDRVPESEWKVVSAEPPVDILIFEGWCLGFEALDDRELARRWTAAQELAETATPKPDKYNGDIAQADDDGIMSTMELHKHPLNHIQEVNTNLARYNQGFMSRARFDILVHLDTPMLQNVYRWRIQQENALRATKGTGQTDQQVVPFVKVYMPAYELYLDGLRRPKAGLPQIVASCVTGEECESLILHGYNDKWREGKRGMWNRVVHADFKRPNNPIATSSRANTVTSAILARPTAADVAALRRLRLVSRSWNRSVRKLLRQHEILTLDLDYMDTVTGAIVLCTAAGRAEADKGQQEVPVLPKNVVILAGDAHIRPFRRYYTYDSEFRAGVTFENEALALGNFRDTADLEDSDSDPERSSYRPRHLQLRPRPQRTDESQVGHPSRLRDDQKHALLRVFLQRCHQVAGHESSAVKTLSVQFPPANSWIRGYDEHGAQCYDLPALDALIDVLRTSLFFVPTRWTQAGTADDSSMAADTATRSPRQPQPKILFPHLRNLFVAVTDATGPCGSSDYTGHEFGYNFDLTAIDGDMTDPYVSGYPPSNLQLRGDKNRDHQLDLWRFVASCRTVEALYIEATHALSLDQLWRVIDGQGRDASCGSGGGGPATASDEAYHSSAQDQRRLRDWTRTGLQILGLSRINTSTASLARMIRPSPPPPESTRLAHAASAAASPIRRLNLCRVRIVHDSDARADADKAAATAGSQAHVEDGDRQSSTSSSDISISSSHWADIFAALMPRHCPDLEFLGMHNLSYMSTHPDFAYISRPGEDFHYLWTESGEDLRALAELFRSNERLAVQGLDRRWQLGKDVAGEEGRDLIFDFRF